MTVLAFPARHTTQGDPWEPWVSEPTIAQHYGVTSRTVRRWREQGMPSRLIGGARRYRLSSVDEWLQAQERS